MHIKGVLWSGYMKCGGQSQRAHSRIRRRFPDKRFLVITLTLVVYFDLPKVFQNDVKRRIDVTPSERCNHTIGGGGDTTANPFGSVTSATAAAAEVRSRPARTPSVRLPVGTGSGLCCRRHRKVKRSIHAVVAAAAVVVHCCNHIVNIAISKGILGTELLSP